MSIALFAAPVNNIEDGNQNKNQNQNQNLNVNNNNGACNKKLNKTYKNKQVAQPKITKNSLQNLEVYNDSEEDSIQQSLEQPAQQPVQQQLIQGEKMNDPSVSQEGFSKLESTYASDYYKQFSPYQGSYQIPQPSVNSNNELLKKLDNILHLLEEQQEEKTNLITEELILYVFLGVFVIYVLDSFVKVGKYTR